MDIFIGGARHTLEVTSFFEFPRGPDGLCALCHADPCAENSPPDSLIAQLYRAEPRTSTCPVCDGRPS